MASERMREALRWLVNLHYGVSRGTVLVDEDDGVVRIPASVTEDEFAAAITEGREALEESDEQTRLEAAVVEAALAERRAEMAYEQMTRTVWPCQYSRETVQPVYAAQKALAVAIDALLAFLEEGNDAD